MAVGPLDRTVFTVNLEFGFLVATDLATDPFRFGLRGDQVTGALAPVTLNLPPAILVWHYSMRISGHTIAPAGVRNERGRNDGAGMPVPTKRD